ncbi:MAG: hypothetical protein IMW91_09915 [Firmicutes bacterium]|nr:hypothetical protein [Bacillota bacterium]
MSILAWLVLSGCVPHASSQAWANSSLVLVTQQKKALLLSGLDLAAQPPRLTPLAKLPIPAGANVVSQSTVIAQGKQRFAVFVETPSASKPYSATVFDVVLTRRTVTSLGNMNDGVQPEIAAGSLSALGSLPGHAEISKIVWYRFPSLTPQKSAPLSFSFEGRDASCLVGEKQQKGAVWVTLQRIQGTQLGAQTQITTESAPSGLACTEQGALVALSGRYPSGQRIQAKQLLPDNRVAILYNGQPIRFVQVGDSPQNVAWIDAHLAVTDVETGPKRTLVFFDPLLGQVTHRTPLENMQSLTALSVVADKVIAVGDHELAIVSSAGKELARLQLPGNSDTYDLRSHVPE